MKRTCRLTEQWRVGVLNSSCVLRCPGPAGLRQQVRESLSREPLGPRSSRGASGHGTVETAAGPSGGLKALGAVVTAQQAPHLSS